VASECIFCRIVAGDVPSTRIAESERAIAIMDINPATAGHALVLPRAHSTDLYEIGDEDLYACALLAREIAGRAVDRLGAEGVTVMQSNGAAAWQTVFHYHVHVIPRYAGDPLKLPWTPAPGDTEQIEAASRSYLGSQPLDP
jgi:histidine triad (HIT) family protein